MEFGGKLIILGKKEVEFNNGKGILNVMCSRCFNQKKWSDICLLIKYENKEFYGGGIKNAIYLFNEKRWVDVDIFGSIILHNKFINIICEDGNLYKMRIVDFQRGHDNDHIQFELIKNLRIGGFEDEFSDSFVKYEGKRFQPEERKCIYEGKLNNEDQILFHFKKKKLLKTDKEIFNERNK